MSDNREPKKTFPDGKVFNIDLSEDEIDQCTHAINELCGSFIKDGVDIKDPNIQSYLKLSEKLNMLLDSNHAYPTINITKDTPCEQRTDIVAAWLEDNGYNEKSLVSLDESEYDVVVIDVQCTI